MISSSNKLKAKKSCVYCGSKMQDSYFVLSDESCIHKDCLEILQLSLGNVSLDEDMKQFYNFIISKVVNCHTCNCPLDLFHNDYMTLPQCSKCKPFNALSQKVQSQICELCDTEIAQNNKLKKPSVILGIIMCRACYNLQTGQIEQKQQEKPDLRLQNKKEETCNIFRFGTGVKNLEQKRNLQYLSEKPKPKKEIKQEMKPPLLQIPPQITTKQQQQDTFGLQTLFKEKQILAYKAPLSQKKPIKQLKIEKVMKREQKVGAIDTTIFEVIGQAQQPNKYSLKECKICFNSQSQMMNQRCRHLMMCQPCYKMMLQRQNKKNQLFCPVCQTLGKYFKYLQPIYI